MIALRIGVRHDFAKGAAKVESISPQLDAKMAAGTEEATILVGNAAESLVVSRTSMNQTIAARITEAKSEASPGPGRSRGRVRFTDPPPGGWEIRPKNKKALSFVWRGRKVAFARIQHPGSRPYPLIGRAATASTQSVGRIYESKVGEIL